MNNISKYKPYENWKSFKIIEEQGKKFLELYEFKLEIDTNNYVPKAGLLFEEVLKSNSKDKEILDLGCGQLGILGLIALHYGAKKLVSVDVDEKCIEWLNRIVDDNNIKNVNIIKSDMFSKIDNNEKFDLILSNPPHMPMKDGKLCDDGGIDGKYFIKKIIKESYEYLKNDGELNVMMFDFLGVDKSYNNDESVFEMANKIGYKDMQIIFSFDRYITKESMTYKCLDYIKTIYPKYHFDEEIPKCKLIICKFKK